MRIAEIAPPWFALPPTGYGGIEWVVSLLADGLVERGHDVTLFAPPGSVTKGRLVSPLDAEPARGSIGDEWVGATHAVTAYLRMEQFDLLHDHTNTIGPAIGSFASRPVVHTLHGAWSPRSTNLFSRIGQRLWFVAISDSQRSLAPPGLRWGGMVHNGIPIDRYPYREDKDDYLLFLGRVNEDKAPDLAIRAARMAGCQLVMCVKVAEAYERRYWSEVVEPLLGPDVHVEGEVSHERKAELLAGARALLFPIQWQEPFGLVMAEAMACGTPVVAWRNGAVPEVVAEGETGFIVDSLEDFAEAIGKVDTLEPRTMREHVRQHFSPGAMVDGYEAVFERVLAGQRD